VFDVSEAAIEPLLLRQARRAASPRELADHCEIVAVSLPTLAAFRTAVLASPSYSRQSRFGVAEVAQAFDLA
jgi:3-hydroxyisobutyrate dehydrogenase-like beta-hydroxyacid dehydrogenase